VPKNIAGQNEAPPVEFVWGTFCREIVMGAGNNQDCSLIGLLTGLDVNVEVLKKQPEYQIPLMVWLHIRFKYRAVVKFADKFALSAKLSYGEKASVLKKLDVVQQPKQDILQMNLNLMMMNQGERLVLKEGKTVLKMSFRYKNTDLGMVELPINVIVRLPKEGHE
jgi:hypothetical protein